MFKRHFPPRYMTFETLVLKYNFEHIEKNW